MTIRALVTMCAFGVMAVAAERSGSLERPGSPATGPWACPASHPIKGYVLGESGRHVYFVPAHPFYDEASPERCYASEDEARRDGSQPVGSPPATFTPVKLTPREGGPRT
jgi:hypothetical protein